MTVSQAALALEQALGDPFRADHGLSFSAAVARDEAEEFPGELVDACLAAGLQRWFVPAELGGELRRYAEPAALLRVVARRDLTAAIALGQSFLGSAPIWIAGSSLQQERMAELLLSGECCALALTEEAHGSDILASELRATPAGDGYVLEGEKWLINNATRGAALTLFARTAPEGGLDGFSLLMLDKAALPGDCFTQLERKKTLGLRGADISGIRLTGAGLPAQALVGQLGSGLDCVLKALQVTRAGCASFSLGAADSALRIVLDFAMSRRLYGGTVLDIPHARACLNDAFVDLLCCDVLAILAPRLLHLLPEQMSLMSAVVKSLVPTMLERAIRELAMVLGARHYLREGPAGGVFQKFLRDAAVVSLFDGSTAVNLELIGLQLPRLCDRRLRCDPAPLASLFGVDQPLPDFDPGRLALLNRGRDAVVQGLPQAERGLACLPSSELVRELQAQVGTIVRALEELEAELAERPAKRSWELLELSRRYGLLYTACAVLQLWLHSRQAVNEFFEKGEWVALCLHRLLGKTPARHPLEFAGEARMLELYRDNRLFSLLDFALAERE
ncbi:MAG: putative acyl-CoA dehydrogenase [Candidatus Xenobia bacterium]